MSFKDMVQRDLDASTNINEFATEVTHINGEYSEDLNCIFESNTEIVLDDGSRDGVITSAPSLTLPTSKAENIDNDSIFYVDGTYYEVMSYNNQRDLTTIVYLKVASND